MKREKRRDSQRERERAVSGRRLPKLSAAATLGHATCLVLWIAEDPPSMTSSAPWLLGAFLLLLVAPAHSRPDLQQEVLPKTRKPIDIISKTSEGLLDILSDEDKKTISPVEDDKGVLLDKHVHDDHVHSCPNCPHPKNEHEQKQLDNLRIENIKQQILSKLGLKTKPNISSSIPRDVLLQTLYRSDDTRPLLTVSDDGIFQDDNVPLEDDYFAKTSEIISFAEPGKLFNHFFCDM